MAIRAVREDEEPIKTTEPAKLAKEPYHPFNDSATQAPPPPPTPVAPVPSYTTGMTVGDMHIEDFNRMLAHSLADLHEKQGERRSRTLEERGLPENVFTKTMHFTGNTLHGVVDIAEGITRGTVDLVTMGYAKR